MRSLRDLENAVTGPQAARAYELLPPEVVSPAGKRVIPWLHFLLLGVCFFLSIQDFQASTWDINRPADFFTATSGSGSHNAQIAFVLLALYGGFGLFLRARRALRLHWAVIASSGALLCWTLGSVLWSTSPKESLTRLTGVIALVLAGTRVHRRFQSLTIVCWITCITLIYAGLGLAAEFIVGTFRPWEVEYRFSGTLHPNAQGVNCSLAFLGAFWLTKQGTHRRLWRVLAAIAFVLDLMTKSRTAILSALIALGVTLILSQRNRLWRQLLVWCTAVIILFGVWLQINGMTPASNGLQLGRDAATSDNSSLTGRVPLWSELMDSVDKHPVIGFGFGAFWTQTNIERVSDDQGWGISAAHSCYVDVLLALGGIGLVLYCAAIATGIRQAFSQILTTRDPGSAFFGTLLLFVAVDGVTDSEPVIVSAFLCFCFILALCELSTTSIAADASPSGSRAAVLNALAPTIS